MIALAETDVAFASIAAVFWDLDGTLVDSEGFWLEAAGAILLRHHLAMSDDVRGRLVGASAKDSAAILIAEGVEMRSEDVIAEIIVRVADQLADSVLFRPGAVDLLTSVAAAGIPQALVTMSWRQHVSLVARALPGRFRFDAIVAGDDIVRGKPDPEAYLRAASLLGVDPRLCVVIEDSRAGTRAGAASGATTIAVPLHQAVDDLDHAATWPTLKDRTFTDLAEVHSRRIASGTEGMRTR